MPAKITSIIVCDDVRKEITGKDILIGVYSGTINVSAYPVTFPIALWFEIEPDEAGDLNCGVKIETPSGNPPIQAEVTIHVQEVETAVFVLGGVPMSVERDGDLIISVKFGKEDWMEVKRKKVQRQAFPMQPPLVQQG